MSKLLILASFPALTNAATVLPINQSGVWQVGLRAGAGVKGTTTQLSKLRIIIAKGAIRKTIGFDLLGIIISLHKSFNPSARG
jgi:hypothetical protein